jgi:hypothetical protein
MSIIQKHGMGLLLSIAGVEQEIKVEVSYIHQPSETEILSIRAPEAGKLDYLDISWLFNDSTKEWIAKELP